VFVTIDPLEELAMAPLVENRSRRSFLTASAALAATALGTNLLAREYGPSAPPTRYPDPDILVLDPRFKKYALGNSAILRLYHSQKMMWAEGCAWNGVGRYLVWSDIPNNIQRRWLEEDGHVSVFRNPAQYSNGNTFDYQGRQLSFEHETRRVVRYEADGSVTVLASAYNNKSLNAPNDGIVHPSGDIWFTDPGYGAIMNYEGVNANNGSVQPFQKEAIYRIDSKTGKLHQVADDIFKPNGICFSPDYKKLYVADTGAPREIRVFDVDGTALRNGRSFVKLDIPGTGAASAADGIRCDADGNLWAGARPGVQVIAPTGQRLGLIQLPETCANVCFGGARRNRLFMVASQSLYAVYVNTTGAHIT
jgi:gluconolactonase